LRRIGQKNDTVFAYYFTVPDSLDTVMENTLDAKRKVIRKVIKSDGVTYMSLDNLLERAVNALETIAANLTGGTPQKEAPAPAAKKPAGGGKAPAAKKPAEPDPVVEPKAAETNHNEALEKVNLEAGVFIKAGGDKAGQDRNRAIINEQIWPKYGATQLKDLDPAHYEAAIEDLKQGASAFLSDDEDMGV
jgi:HAMP domain-containing protein